MTSRAAIGRVALQEFHLGKARPVGKDDDFGLDQPGVVGQGDHGGDGQGGNCLTAVAS
jgi:hypothetical protein